MKNKTKYLISLLLVISVLIILVCSKLTPFDISMSVGDSMLPTMSDRNITVSVKDIDKIERNKIYNMYEPKTGSQIVKRVVAIEGDTIEIKDGKLYVNNEKDTSAFSDGVDYSVHNGLRYTLDKDQYFVLGDNRPVSIDSRYFGPVDKRYFISKVIFSLD